MIQAVVLLAGAQVGVSLLVGALLGLSSAIWAREIEGAVRIIVDGYYALVTLLPITLWLTLYLTPAGEDYKAAYDSQLHAIVTTLQGAVIGATLGAGPIFLVVATNLPLMLSRVDLNGLGAAVRNEIIWPRLLLAVGASVMSAIPLGLWAYYVRSEWTDKQDR